MNNKQNHSFYFVDLFSGIGGFRLALENNGGKCIGFSEIDKTAIHTYKKNFDTKNEIELGSIKNIDYTTLHQQLDKMSMNIDVVTGGVPCQSWSVAGKRKGFEDPRGALWFDTIKFVENIQPKTFIFENVKGLADPRNKDNLYLIVKSFQEIGYRVFYKVLNGFHFGLPQNRERIFFVGIRNNINKNFQFPNKYPYLPVLRDFLDELENKNNKSERLNKTKNNDNQEYSYIKNAFNMSAIANKEHFFTFCDTRNGKNTIHSWDLIDTTQQQKDICMSLLKNRRKKIYGEKDGNPLSIKELEVLNPKIQKETLKKELEFLVHKHILKIKEGKYDFQYSKNSSGILDIYRLFLPSSHVFSTLTKSGVRDFISKIDIPNDIKDRKTYVIEKIFKPEKYRKITKTEALRIQGFPEDYMLPDNYQKSMGLLGNALCVNIVEEIVKELKKQLIIK